jgi:hypothetical protein
VPDGKRVYLFQVLGENEISMRFAPVYAPKATLFPDLYLEAFFLL